MMNRSDASLEQVRPQPIAPLRGDSSPLRQLPPPWEFSSDRDGSSIVPI
jgi:hypothetical protein